MLRRSVLLLTLLFVGQTMAMAIPVADAQCGPSGTDPCGGAGGPGAPTCGAGTHPVGDHCEANPPPTCGQGTHPVGDHCEANPPPTCGQGMHPVGDHCEANPPPTCGQGTHPVGDHCEANPPPTCGDGQHLEGDHCVPNSTSTPPANGGPNACPAGQHMEGQPQHCVDNPPTCGANQHPEGAPAHCVDNAGAPAGPGPGQGNATACPGDAHREGDHCVPNAQGPGGNATGGGTPPPCPAGETGTPPNCSGCQPHCGGAAGAGPGNGTAAPCPNDAHKEGDRCVPNNAAGPGNATGAPPQCGPNQHPEGQPPKCVDGAPKEGGVQCAPDQHVEGPPPHCVSGPPCDPQRAQCGPPPGAGGQPSCGSNASSSCGAPPCASGSGGDPNAARTCGGSLQCGESQHIEGDHCAAGPPGQGPRNAPNFCNKNDDGTFTCKPPPDCANCRPPPNCETQPDGSYRCKPQDPATSGGNPNPQGAPPCPPPGANETPKPCGPPAGCSPENPCHADAPAFCEKQADGTVLCSPPPECVGKIGSTPQCTPPPNCASEGDKFRCKPFDARGGQPGDIKNPNATFRDPCGPRPNPPTATSANASDPCQGGGPAQQPPPCTPKPDGTLSCAPPPQCGGAAFAGAAGDGCQPPAFCKKSDAGTYDCKPPEECRGSAGGWQKCYAPPSGAACEKLLEDYAAAGQFTPCAAPPTQFCPPPAPGQTTPPKCQEPPKPPHPCAPGEAQFPPDHPAGTPPVCYLAGRVDNGTYVPPFRAVGNDCAPPPPGEWPPAQPAPSGKVWCPPQGYAPPPMKADEFRAWENFTRANAPPGVNDFLQQFGGKFEELNATQLEELHRAGTVHNLFAPPQFDGRSLNGSFVRSTFTDGLGIRNYSVGGVEFFHSANPRGGGNATFSTTVGSAAVAASGGLVLETHNTGSGAMVYRHLENPDLVTGDVHIDFNPSFVPDRNVTFDGGVVLRNGDWSGVLVGNADVLPNGTIDVTVNGSRPAIFMAIPPTGLEHDTRLDIAHGVADGKVFGEVSLVARNGTVGQDLTLYAPDTSAFSIEVTDHTADAVNVSISGEGEGQALVFTVDRSTLTTPLADFNVTIDGATLAECTNFTELEASAKSGGCFTLNANETALRVSVMPEHFSSHLISLGSVRPVTSTAASASPTDAPTGTDKGKDTSAGTASGSGTDTTKTTASSTPVTSTAAATHPAAPAKTPGVGVVGVIAVGIAAVALIGRRRR